MKTKIGTFIRKAREAKGLTLAEVGNRMPITADTVGAIESGEIKTPSEPVISAFARVLGVSVAAIKTNLPDGATPRSSIAKNKEVARLAAYKMRYGR